MEVVKIKNEQVIDREELKSLVNEVCDDYISLCTHFRISQNEYEKNLKENPGTFKHGYACAEYRILNDNGTKLLNNIHKLKRMINS